jgi:hypothetical protein
MGEEGANEAGGTRASMYVLFRNALREARDLGRYSGISGRRRRHARTARQRPA